MQWSDQISVFTFLVALKRTEIQSSDQSGSVLRLCSPWRRTSPVWRRPRCWSCRHRCWVCRFRAAPAGRRTAAPDGSVGRVCVQRSGASAEKVRWVTAWWAPAWPWGFLVRNIDNNMKRSITPVCSNVVWHDVIFLATLEIQIFTTSWVRQSLISLVSTFVFMLDPPRQKRFSSLIHSAAVVWFLTNEYFNTKQNSGCSLRKRKRISQ